MSLQKNSKSVTFVSDVRWGLYENCTIAHYKCSSSHFAALVGEPKKLT